MKILVLLLLSVNSFLVEAQECNVVDAKNLIASSLKQQISNKITTLLDSLNIKYSYENISISATELAMTDEFNSDWEITATVLTNKRSLLRASTTARDWKTIRLSVSLRGDITRDNEGIPVNLECSLGIDFTHLDSLPEIDIVNTTYQDYFIGRTEIDSYGYTLFSRDLP